MLGVEMQAVGWVLKDTSMHKPIWMGFDDLKQIPLNKDDDDDDENITNGFLDHVLLLQLLLVAFFSGGNDSLSPDCGLVQTACTSSSPANLCVGRRSIDLPALAWCSAPS